MCLRIVPKLQVKRTCEASGSSHGEWSRIRDESRARGHGHPMWASGPHPHGKYDPRRTRERWAVFPMPPSAPRPAGPYNNTRPFCVCGWPRMYSYVLHDLRHRTRTRCPGPIHDDLRDHVHASPSGVRVDTATPVYYVRCTPFLDYCVCTCATLMRSSCRVAIFMRRILLIIVQI